MPWPKGTNVEDRAMRALRDYLNTGFKLARYQVLTPERKTLTCIIEDEVADEAQYLEIAKPTQRTEQGGRFPLIRSGPGGRYRQQTWRVFIRIHAEVDSGGQRTKQIPVPVQDIVSNALQELLIDPDGKEAVSLLGLFNARGTDEGTMSGAAGSPYTETFSFIFDTAVLV